LNHTEEILYMVLISDDNTPEVLKPSKQAFDFPSAPIRSQLTSILSFMSLATFAMRRHHLDITLVKQSLIKFIAVVSLVSYQSIRSILSKTIINGCFNQFHFMGRSAFNVSGDRKTSSVCDGQDLGALAALCLADSKTPFFAGTKVPSMKASRISIPPRPYRSCASSWAIRLKTPNLTHCWNRLWQVWYGGYRGGKSFQGAPVRNIHNIASKTSRGSRGLRPRGSLRGFADCIMGSIRFHCSFVISILIILHIQDEMSRIIFNGFA
jgi:hypothetical protein